MNTVTECQSARCHCKSLKTRRNERRRWDKYRGSQWEKGRGDEEEEFGKKRLFCNIKVGRHSERGGWVVRWEPWEEKEREGEEQVIGKNQLKENRKEICREKRRGLYNTRGRKRV